MTARGETGRDGDGAGAQGLARGTASTRRWRCLCSRLEPFPSSLHARPTLTHKLLKCFCVPA